MKEIPEVDAVLGTTSYDGIITALDKVFEGERYEEFKDINVLPANSKKRMITTGGYFEYLKIAEGCDKRCTYCIIPKLRGELQKRANGAAAVPGCLSGRAGCERADFSGTGNNGLRKRPLRGEISAQAVKKNCAKYRGFSGFGFFTVIRRKFIRNSYRL